MSTVNDEDTGTHTKEKCEDGCKDVSLCLSDVQMTVVALFAFQIRRRFFI